MPQQRKLTHDEVRDIRRSNLSQALAARKYGVDRKTIRNVRQGVTYQDVPDRTPIASGAHLRLEKKYLVGDALELLDQVPDGYAATVLTMATPLTGPVGRGEHLDHVDRQRRIIQECLRAAGEFGFVMYVHRPRFGYGAGVDLGADIIGGLPLRQAIIWTWPVRARHRCRRQRNAIASELRKRLHLRRGTLGDVQRSGDRVPAEGRRLDNSPTEFGQRAAGVSP